MVELAQRIIRSGDTAPLLERGTQLDALTRAFDAARGGAGATVLVAGEAGIGKTTLVEYFSAQSLAPRILWGACEALFTPRPLGPLHDIARRVGGPLLELLSSGAPREALFAACLAELEREPQPALVVIEDVHWADEATLDLLKFLGRRISRMAALLVVTYRDDELAPDHPLRTLIGTLPSDSVRRLTLSPLTASAVSTLAKRAGRDASEVYGVTSGNPFFLTEVLATAPGTVPQSVRDAVLARAARLAGPAREVLEAVATVPGHTEHWLLAELIGEDAAAVDACVASGVLQYRERERAVAYRHELGRRAIELSLAPQRARLWHARVFAALERVGASHSISPSRLVHHAEKAGDPVAVLRVAPHAAERAAAVGAHREAAAHLGSAIAFADALPGRERALLYDRRAYECYLTDQHREAIEARLKALEIWRAIGDPLREGDTLRWLSRLSWFLARNDDAVQYAKDAIAILKHQGATRELAAAYSNCAQLYALAENVRDAIEWGGRAIALAREFGDEETVAQALNAVGSARANALDDEGLTQLRESLDIALDRRLQEHVARAYCNLGCAYTEQHRADAAGYLDAGIQYSEERDLGSWALYIHAWRAKWRLDRGDWQGAFEDADCVLRNPRAAAMSRLPALAAAGRRHVRMGDGRAAELLDEGLALARASGEFQRIAPIAAARAEAAWLAGDDQKSQREAGEAYRHAEGLHSPWRKGELALWLSRTGGLAEVPTDIAEPFALEIAGDWAGAAQAWSRLSCPYEQALALASSGDPAAMREALGILQRLGASGTIAGLRNRLKAQGSIPVPRGSRKSTRGNPAGLTNRQLDVLRLVVEGLSNAEIADRLGLSPRTVDHHVSAVLSKLEAGTRAQAMAMAVSRGIVPPPGR
jgi:DNA-binding CsgD family transcriptional regulator/tetratricopeptide (TPR) repeat protein